MDHRIEARIAALETELSSLKALVATDAESGPATSDRRGMVKLLAASAVGVVTGAAILGAQPAAAAQGGNAVLGQFNDSDTATTFRVINDTAVLAHSDAGYGIEAIGGKGNAWFLGAGPSPLGLPGDNGALAVDGAGNWWAATVTSATDANWRKLAGPSTAGQLHLLSAPVRVYDSRPGENPAAVGPKSPTTTNEARTIDITLGGTAVPATANAVMITLTIAGPLGGGFVHDLRAELGLLRIVGQLLDGGERAPGLVAEVAGGGEGDDVDLAAG